MGVPTPVAGRTESVARFAADPVALVSRPAPFLWPALRAAGSIDGVPGRTGLVRGTSGRQDLGATAIGLGRLWVVEQPWHVVADVYQDLPARLLSVDLRTRRVIGRPIPVGRGAYSLAFGSGSVWVANSADGTVSRIDPSSHRVLATIPIGGRNVDRLTVSHGFVWVVRDDYDTAKRGGRLFRIDPGNNRVVGSTVLGKNMCGSFGLAASQSAVWVTGDAQGDVIRIDPATGRIEARIHVRGAPIGPIVVRGSLWVANESESAVKLWRIDPATGLVTAVKRYHFPGWMLQPSAGMFWTTDGASVTMVDPFTGTAERSFALPNTYQFQLHGHILWAVSWDSAGTGAIRWVDLRQPLRAVDVAPSRVA